jgi:hypothetical protein
MHFRLQQPHIYFSPCETDGHVMKREEYFLLLRHPFYIMH